MYETTCSRCGCVLDDEEVLLFQEDVYCVDCLEELTVLCYHCGKRIYRQDNEGNADILIHQPMIFKLQRREIMDFQ